MTFDLFHVAQFGAAVIQLSHLHTVLSGKAQCRLGGVAVGIKRRGDRWPVNILHPIRLLGGQCLHQHRQAPGGGIGVHLGVWQAGAFQAADNACAKTLRQLIECFGRQLFGAQFHQKILCAHAASSCASFASTSSRRLASAMGKPSLARAFR